MTLAILWPVIVAWLLVLAIVAGVLYLMGIRQK